MRDESSSGDRRQFLKKLGIAAAGGFLANPMASVLAQSAALPALATTPGLVPKRKFGKHDIEVSSMALGGHTLATASSDEESYRIVDEAIAAVSPSWTTAGTITMAGVKK